MKNVLVLGLGFIVFNSFVLSVGHASSDIDYRLIFVRNTERSFNPKQDLTIPSTGEKVQHKIRNIFTRTVLEGFVPLAGKVKLKKESFNSNVLLSLMSSANSMREGLINHLEKVDVEEAHKYVIYLVPWKANVKDLFYSSDKISASRSDSFNVLKVTPEHKDFFHLMTKEMKELHSKFAETAEVPAYLLGLKFHLMVDKNLKNLVISALVGVHGQDITLPESIVNDQVHISKIVIPSKKTVAKIDFIIPLDKTQGIDELTPPIMSLNFGEFLEFKESPQKAIGTFILNEKGKNRTTPRLEGSPKFDSLEGGKKWVFRTLRGLAYPLRLLTPIKDIAINFNISNLTFNLLTQRVSKLNIILSPGLKVGKNNKVVGSLRLDNIDSQFQSEINNELEKNINKAIADGKVQIDSILKMFQFAKEENK